MSKIGPGTAPPIPPSGQQVPGGADQPRTGLPQGFDAQPRSKAMDSLAELNGILDFAGLGTLTDDVIPVSRGSGRDAPNAGGAVRDRGTPVKDFFKAIGGAIADGLSAIGRAIGSAASKVQDFFAARTQGTAPTATAGQAAQTATPAMQAPTVSKAALAADALKMFADDLEKMYGKLPDDDTKPTREAFVAGLMPGPEGGLDALDQGSALHFGDIFDETRAAMRRPSDADAAAMMDAMMDHMQTLPTLDAAVEVMMGSEIENLASNPAVFLRGNCAYSKTEKVLTKTIVPLPEIVNDTLAALADKLTEHRDLAVIDGVTIAMESLTPEQADAMFDLSDTMLTALLDTDPDNPDSYLNKIPGEFRDFVAAQAERILADDTIPRDVRQDAVEMMYANSFFLRSVLGEVSVAMAMTLPSDTGEKNMGIRTAQLTQTLLNGVTDYSAKGNDNAQGALDRLWDNHGDRVTAFFRAAGMPEFD